MNFLIPFEYDGAYHFFGGGHWGYAGRKRGGGCRGEKEFPESYLALREMGYENALQYLIEHDYHFRTDGSKVVILGSAKSGYRGHSGGRGGKGNPGGSRPRGGSASQGGGGALVDNQFFTTGPGRALFDDDITDEDIEAFGSVMMEAKITESDLEGMFLFTTEAPPGYSDDGDRFVSDLGRGRGIHGRYDRNNRIYVHPDNAGTSTTIHEIGHHIAQRNLGSSVHSWVGDIFGKSVVELDRLLKAQKKSMLPDSMARAGLRQYSFSRIGEFLADAFKVRKLGTKEQNMNLDNIVEILQIDLNETFR